MVETLMMDPKTNLNMWRCVKTAEFPKEKPFDLLDVRGIVITSNLKGSRKIIFQKPNTQNQ